VSGAGGPEGWSSRVRRTEQIRQRTQITTFGRRDSGRFPPGREGGVVLLPQVFVLYDCASLRGHSTVPEAPLEVQVPTLIVHPRLHPRHWRTSQILIWVLDGHLADAAASSHQKHRPCRLSPSHAEPV
jgi:hypothetical protein